MYSNYEMPTDLMPVYDSIKELESLILFLSFISFISTIILIISNWKIYKKAGKGGWESIIPIYNIIVLLQIAELPLWYLILFIIPIANIIVIFKIYIELAHKFGKSTGFGVATVFFNFICLPILAFGKNNVYVGGVNNKPQNNNNNTATPTPQYNSAIPQVELNNSINNNINNELQNEAPPFMFDQNIDTSINPIQQIQNNEFQQPTPMVDNKVENSTIQQPVNQPQNVQVNENQNLQPVTLEPQLNGINNVENQSQQSIVQEPNGISNLMEQQPIKMPQDNMFKYEIPEQTGQPQQESTQQNTFINPIPQPVQVQQNVQANENQNLQPAPQEPQLNVIPGMGTIPQPVSPNPNVVNNQNNSNL